MAAQLPKLPVPLPDLVDYIAKHPKEPLTQVIEPYRKYEAQLREVYAQDGANSMLSDSQLNVIPVFNDHVQDIKVRARNLTSESQEENERYIMALPEEQRREDGSPAVVQSLKEFRHNFNVFSESALADMDWDNVVAAGSSVVNCLLPVPDKYKDSKRALREYYHEKFCPASDVDLFLYGLTEEQALQKIKVIETRIRDAILSETTTVRTKYAVTICSQYPTRHIQIVLRIYKNVSEILTGFDIDSSGAAFDGKQVYVTPRALQSYMTQINHIDLSRRSPSYENRLSKYSHRGFEVYWPDLDRSRVDPTIFERSFQRTLGLARLLVLERLPTASARDDYLAKRRNERGRPPLHANRRFNQRIWGNIKDEHEDEIADWVDAEEVSNYHTFTIPYGQKFHAKKIEKLCYTRDLLLNAEWNEKSEREVYLHRHPAFFGRFEDVAGDCCGFCPVPTTEEEKEVAEEDAKTYISGKVTFIKDNPGRQQIGSFNPLTDDDWTEMAYVGNTARLCQAIVDRDLEHVQDWLAQEGADPNTRDYTGRTPLHLAVISSSVEIVQCLIDHDSRLVARLADGRTALHLAAERGDVDIVKAILNKSEENEAAEEEKQAQKKKLKAAEGGKVDTTQPGDAGVDQMDEDDNESLGSKDTFEEVDAQESDNDDSADTDSVATGGFVKLAIEEAGDAAVVDEKEDEPDFYDINVVSWDVPLSALHYAVIGGHAEVVKVLCEQYGADVLLPIKFFNQDKNPQGAILTLVLCLALPLDQAVTMVQLLISLGSTCAQADVEGITAFYKYVQKNAAQLIETLGKADASGCRNAVNHFFTAGYGDMQPKFPLQSAIEQNDIKLVGRLLDLGSVSQIDFGKWIDMMKSSSQAWQLRDLEGNKERFQQEVQQPFIVALQQADPSIALELLKRGADVNVMTKESSEALKGWSGRKGQSALDAVQAQIEYLEGYTNPNNALFLYEPELPKNMQQVLDSQKEGSWQRAMCERDIEHKNAQYKTQIKYFEEKKEKLAKQEPNIAEQQRMVDELLKTLKEVNTLMTQKGAKTFKEMYPEWKPPQQSTNQTSSGDDKTVYKFKSSFQGIYDMTDARFAKYVELFEAAWSGDLEKIKSLTLQSWDPDNNEPPLRIAIQDDNSNNPLSLAYQRGHLDIVPAILDIAQAQNVKEDEPAKRYRLMGEDDESAYDSDGEMREDDDDDAPNLYSQIVDDKFTIENIGQVSLQVKSSISPATLLGWSAKCFRMEDGDVKWLKQSESLLDRAIRANDRKALKLVYDLMVKYQTSSGDQDDKRNLVAFPDSSFLLAVDLGRTELLADIISWCGAGLPLESMVKTTGVEVREKPRYYQGLTVYGKKRNDWANAGRNVVSRPSGVNTAPLIQATLDGRIESVEWFLSDAPSRYYAEFGNSAAAKSDARLKHLIKAPGGFTRAVNKWLGAENDLVVACSVLGQDNPTSAKLLRYLINAFPASLEARTNYGHTALLLAATLGRLKKGEILIKAGANQSVKTKDFRNILHLLLENAPKVDQLKAFVKLLDHNLLLHLFRERTSISTGDGRTPLHYWISRRLSDWSMASRHQWSPKPIMSAENDLAVLRLLLSYSKGGELDMLDASGNTILHTMIGSTVNTDFIRVVLDLNPTLLYRESAVGRTPIETARDMFVAHVADKDQVTHGNQYHRYYYGRNEDKSIAKKMVDANPEHFIPGKGYVKDPAEHDEDDSNDDVEEEYSGPDRRSPQQKVWDCIKEYMDKNPGRRRLVGLHEANDVARRIGEAQGKNRYGGVEQRPHKEETSEEVAEEGKQRTMLKPEQSDVEMGGSQEAEDRLQAQEQENEKRILKEEEEKRRAQQEKTGQGDVASRELGSKLNTAWEVWKPKEGEKANDDDDDDDEDQV